MKAFRLGGDLATFGAAGDKNLRVFYALVEDAKPRPSRHLQLARAFSSAY
jgi:hypothetical protein